MSCSVLDNYHMAILFPCNQKNIPKGLHQTNKQTNKRACRQSPGGGVLPHNFPLAASQDEEEGEGVGGTGAAARA